MAMIKQQSPGIIPTAMLMSLLATPGSPQNGTVDPEREGTCQSLSWMVGRYSGFGPYDEHFPQLAHLMIS